MPNKDCISVKDYLFGAQQTKTDLKKIPTKKVDSKKLLLNIKRLKKVISKYKK